MKQGTALSDVANYSYSEGMYQHSEQQLGGASHIAHQLHLGCTSGLRGKTAAADLSILSSLKNAAQCISLPHPHPPRHPSLCPHPQQR